MIRLTISGNLGKDATVRTLESGDHAISFNVCHTDKFKDSQGQLKETSHWVNCTKWVKAGGSTAIANYLKKGQKVLVEGVPASRGYMLDGDATPKATLECRVTFIELLGSAKDSQSAPQAPTSTHSNTPTSGGIDWNQEVADDLPF